MKRVRGIAAILGFGGLCVLLTATTAFADGNAFVGRWHLNQAESKAPPGEVLPADMMAEFSRVDAKHVKWSITITDAQRRPSIEAFDTPANGEFYPISSDTTAAFVLKGNTLQATFKGPAGETDSLVCTLSAGARKMTCNGTLTRPNEPPQMYLDVYDRM